MGTLFLIGTGAIVGIVIGVIVLLLLIICVGVRNKLKRMEIKVEEAASGIDVALTQRFDTLTKMLDTTKAYAKHEVETLENVINLRNGYNKNVSMKEKSNIASKLNEVEQGIHVVCEQYPVLKSSEVFVRLQSSIADIEERLQAARRLYNSNVSALNQEIVTFPTSIIASMCGVTKKDMFEAENKKRDDVKMEF